MKKTVLFSAATAVSSLVFAVCAMGYAAGEISSVGKLDQNGAALLVAAAAFIAADVISAGVCITGKMKDERSVIYSVSRLFLIVYALNMRDRSSAFLIAAGLNVLMYAVSLFKDYRKFAARNSGAEVSE